MQKVTAGCDRANLPFEKEMFWVNWEVLEQLDEHQLCKPGNNQGGNMEQSQQVDTAGEQEQEGQGAMEQENLAVNVDTINTMKRAFYRFIRVGPASFVKSPDLNQPDQSINRMSQHVCLIFKGIFSKTWHGFFSSIGTINKNSHP